MEQLLLESGNPLAQARIEEQITRLKDFRQVQPGQVIKVAFFESAPDYHVESLETYWTAYYPNVDQVANPHPFIQRDAPGHFAARQSLQDQRLQCLPAGTGVLASGDTWGVYTTGGDNIFWSGMNDVSTQDQSDVIDAGAGDDYVLASWGNDRVQGGIYLFAPGSTDPSTLTGTSGVAIAGDTTLCIHNLAFSV